MVKDDGIARVLESSDDLDARCASSLADANEAGGRDNITVVAFRLEGSEEAAAIDDGRP